MPCSVAPPGSIISGSVLGLLFAPGMWLGLLCMIFFISKQCIVHNGSDALDYIKNFSYDVLVMENEDNEWVQNIRLHRSGCPS